MPETEDWLDPLDAIARREPIPNGAVRVIVMATEDPARAETIGEKLAS